MLEQGWAHGSWRDAVDPTGSPEPGRAPIINRDSRRSREEQKIVITDWELGANPRFVQVNQSHLKQRALLKHCKLVTPRPPLSSGLQTRFHWTMNILTSCPKKLASCFVKNGEELFWDFQGYQQVCCQRGEL